MMSIAWKNRAARRWLESLAIIPATPPMQTAIKKLKHDYQVQYDFIHAPQRTLGFVGGRGSGKTYAGAYRALRAAYGYVGNRKVMKAPNSGIVTAPTQDMLYDATQDAFYTLFGSSYVKEEGKRKTVLKNGSVIRWRSVFNPDYRRGGNVSWWWGDEAAIYTNDVRLILSPMLRQFGEAGYRWFTTTPRGRNWLWQLFERDATEEVRLLRSASKDNPFLDPKIAQELKEEYGDTDLAEQELEGLFIAYQGLVYHNFRRSDHEWRGSMPTFDRVVVGVDWGFASPGVMLVIGLDWDNRAWIAEEHYRTHLTIEDWAKVGQRIAAKYQPQAFYCDPSEPKFVRELNRTPGVRAIAAKNTVEPGLQAVLRRMVIQADGKPRLFVHSSCVNTIEEFEMYQRRPLMDGGGFEDTVIKANDHAMDALRYAIMGVDKPVMAKIGVSNYAR